MHVFSDVYLLDVKGYKCYHPLTQKTYITMDVTFHKEVSYFMKPSSDSPLQGERRNEVQTRGDGMYDVLQAELGMIPVMLRNTDQSSIDGDRSNVILETTSTDDPSDVPKELHVVGMSHELPFGDQLLAAGMTNELHVDGLSNDDSSNGLVQDGGHT